MSPARRVRRRSGRRSATPAGLDTFVLLCASEGLPRPETEVVFAPPRKYRADYCWPTFKVIVERNGGIWRKGGHSSGRGILRDYAKSNLAQVEGWKILVYTPQQLSSLQAIEDLRVIFGFQDRPLSPRVVDAIRDRGKAGEPVAETAEDFGVSRSVVRKIQLTGGKP